MRQLLLLGFSSFVLSCGTCGDERPRCPEEAVWPRCHPDGVAECPLGRLEIEACNNDQVCAEGAGWARCITADSEVCDPASFVLACAPDGSGFDLCDRPLYGTDANTTRWVECTGGDSCVDGESGPHCAPQADDPCARCDPGASCQDGVCTEPDATPCDHSGNECIDGDVKSCVNGFTAMEIECADDEQCITDRCFPSDALPCSDELNQCNGDATQVLACNARYGVFEPTECPEAFVCISSPGGALCHGEDEVPCDALTFDDRCLDANTQQRCSAYLDYTQTVTCPDSCRVSDTGGWCVAADAATCDPTMFAASCISGVATTCSVESHFVTSETCPDDYVCIQDDFGALSFATCLPDIFESCVEPADQSCAGPSTFSWCVGGALFEFACQADQICLQEGIRANCVPNDAPACDPATFVSSCEDKHLIRECFAGREVISNCNNVGERCDPDLGECVY